MRCPSTLLLCAALAFIAPARAEEPRPSATETTSDTGAILVRVLNPDVVAQRHSPFKYKIGTLLSYDMARAVLDFVAGEVIARLAERGLAARVEVVTRSTRAEGWVACDLAAAALVPADVPAGEHQLLLIRVQGMPKAAGPDDPLAPWVDRFTGALNDYIAASIAAELAEYDGEAAFRFTRRQGGDRPARRSRLR